VISLVRRHPVIFYVVVAFAWTWTYVIVFLIAFPIPDNPVRTTPGDLGPTIGALVVTGVVAGRAGVAALLKQVIKWRVGIVWYAIALVGLPLAYISSMALVPGAVGSYTPFSFSDLALLPVLYVFLGITGGPLTEEPGWRGFALPRLQRGRGPLVGTVIVGLMWAAWHLPNYFRPDWESVNGGFSLGGVAVFATVAVTFSVLITWVYNRTGGSVLMAVLLHASLNFSQGLTAQIFPAAKDNEVAPVAMLVVIALVVIVATRSRLGYPSTEVAPDAAPAYTTP